MPTRDEPASTDLTTLAECERVIARGLETFVEVGRALLAIRDEKLYRETHDTFAAYCQDRWNLSKSRAYQLIEASGVVENVQHVGRKPNARQAAELAKVSPDQQAEIWDDVVAGHGDKVTAAKVKAAVEAHCKVKPARDISDAVAPFNEVMERLREAKRSITAIKKTPLREFVTPALGANIRDAMKCLREAMPYAACPWCDGKKCFHCSRTGVVENHFHSASERAAKLRSKHNESK